MTPAVAGFALALLAGQAAAAFGDVAAQVWVERTQRIVAAIDQPIAAGADLGESSLNAGRYLAGIQDACAGLNGGLIKNGGKNMPSGPDRATAPVPRLEAAMERVRFRQEGQGILPATRQCGRLCRKAKPGDDPEAVVTAAAQLAAAAEKLASTRITLVKKSLSRQRGQFPMRGELKRRIRRLPGGGLRDAGRAEAAHMALPAGSPAGGINNVAVLVDGSPWVVSSPRDRRRILRR